MAAAAYADSLLPGVKPPVPEALKGSMNSETILNLVHKCELYFSLVSISNKYIQALFAERLL